MATGCYGRLPRPQALRRRRTLRTAFEGMSISQSPGGGALNLETALYSYNEEKTMKQEEKELCFGAVVYAANKTVLEFLQAFSKHVPLGIALLNSEVRKQIQLALKNRQITSRLDGKKYFVYGIAWSLRPCSFYDSQARQISTSFEQHLKIIYDVEIKEKDQPLIVIIYQGGNCPIYLLPELCGIIF